MVVPTESQSVAESVLAVVEPFRDTFPENIEVPDTERVERLRSVSDIFEIASSILSSRLATTLPILPTISSFCLDT